MDLETCNNVCKSNIHDSMRACALTGFIVSDSLRPVACQAPLSMGFSRQEYWSGLPYPPPGDLPDPLIKSASLMFPALAGGFFTTSNTLEASANP